MPNNMVTSVALVAAITCTPAAALDMFAPNANSMFSSNRPATQGDLQMLMQHMELQRSMDQSRQAAQRAHETNMMLIRLAVEAELLKRAREQNKR